MKQVKILMGCIMLLFFTAAVSQKKIPTPPPVPEVKAEKVIERQNEIKSEVNYPAKPSKPALPPPPTPPPPPPLPPLPLLPPLK